jgi:site-specific DNA recombinase
MTVGIYIRVSTSEQVNEGYSIPAQKERLIAYCAAQGWEDYKFYIDEGVSAKDTNRPKLTLLMEHVEQGKISTILVYRLDRFTRSVKDLYTLLDTLKEYKCAFKSATEPYDTSSAMGKMFIGLVALLAEWETQNLSERIKMALEKKVSGGERVGGIPYGFDLSEDDKLVKNEKSIAVMDMIDKVKKGMSATQLAVHLTQTNNDKIVWHAQAVLRILKNPALYGATRWNDRVFEGTHEGLITKEEFMKLQQILDDRSKHHRRDVENTYLFQGVLSCPNCNHILSVNRYIRKRKNGEQYQGAVYRCHPCRKEGIKTSTVGEGRFLDALYEYMKTVEIPDVEPPKEQNDDRDIYLKQLQQIEKEREKYQRAWGRNFITDEEFEKRMDETKGTYDEIKKKLDETKAPVVIDTEAMKEIVFMFNQSFSYLTQEEKQMFIAQFIQRIDFKLIPQPPKRPDKSSVGKELVVITNVVFR